MLLGYTCHVAGIHDCPVAGLMGNTYPVALDTLIMLLGYNYPVPREHLSCCWDTISCCYDALIMLLGYIYFFCWDTLILLMGYTCHVAGLLGCTCHVAGLLGYTC